MQQITPELSKQGRWFRLGILSATVVTPLVTRWRALRTAERARELWEARRAGSAWPWTRAGAQDDREQPPSAARSSANSGLWLVGVVVGVVATGAAAFILARQRMQHADDQPLELPLPGVNGNGNGKHLVDQARDLLGRAARPTREPAPQMDSPTTANASPAGAASQPAPAVTAEQQTNAEAAAVRDRGASTATGAAVPERALFVGNIRTMVYHQADDDNLPTEDNRVYFASEEEARSAGYRADRGETVESRTEQ